MKGYLRALLDPEFRLGAVRVALIIGSTLFAINHGPALLQRQMTLSRWLSGIVTYAVPYCVNVHGRYVSRRQQRPQVSTATPLEEASRNLSRRT